MGLKFEDWDGHCKTVILVSYPFLVDSEICLGSSSYWKYKNGNSVVPFLGVGLVATFLLVYSSDMTKHSFGNATWTCSTYITKFAFNFYPHFVPLKLCLFSLCGQNLSQGIKSHLLWQSFLLMCKFFKNNSLVIPKKHSQVWSILHSLYQFTLFKIQSKMAASQFACLSSLRVLFFLLCPIRFNLPSL